MSECSLKFVPTRAFVLASSPSISMAFQIARLKPISRHSPLQTLRIRGIRQFRPSTSSLDQPVTKLQDKSSPQSIAQRRTTKPPKSPFRVWPFLLILGVGSWMFREIVKSRTGTVPEQKQLSSRPF
jgi:hypothetical protein